MSFVVVSYPKLERTDFEWIQTVRSKKDHFYYEVVRPHFTFVFPTDKLKESVLIKHVAKIAKTEPKIRFVLTQTKVVKDDFGEFFHTFLIPTYGSSRITQLHDLFYTGVLESELRHDIPYIPHLGIGSSKSDQEMKSLASEIESKGINIAGTIDTMMLANFNGQKVQDTQQFGLQ